MKPSAITNATIDPIETTQIIITIGAARRMSTKIPHPALCLGLAGLLPFIACAIQIVTGQPLGPRLVGPALYALTIYGAVILSFLGGIQWGLVMAAGSSPSQDLWRRYAMSVLPSLVAWSGVWIGGRNGLLLLAAGFSASSLYDQWSTSNGETPPWYPRLRLGLTAAVVASLVAAAFFGPF
jgi:hypothetical protein